MVFLMQDFFQSILLLSRVFLKLHSQLLLIRNFLSHFNFNYQSSVVARNTKLVVYWKIQGFLIECRTAT
jgi:hypothetical protein